MKNRRLALLLAGVIIVLAAIGGWWWRVQHPQLTLDPYAKIDGQTTYSLEIWVENDGGLCQPPPLESEFWSDVTTAFHSLYPNVEISFEVVPASSLDEAMEKALAAGRPPHVLVENAEWFRVWSDLQLPIDRFLPEQERSNYFPAALAHVTVGENHMAWPCQIRPQIWAANKKMLAGLGLDLAVLIDQLGDAATWKGYGWQELKDRLDKAKPIRQPYMAHAMGNSDTLLQLLVTLSGGVVGPKGELLLTKQIIESVLTDWQKWQDEKLLSMVQGTLLTDFVSGRKVAIGPVGPWIWGMGENARLRGYRSLSIPQDIVLIPPPGSTGENGYLGGTMVSVSVFRHRRFQGLAHSRLSMEFARSLSLKLGRELSKNNHGIPACRSVFHEWQQEMGLSASQSENLIEVLERSMGLPPLAAEWHEVRRRMVGEILIPALDEVILGRAGPDTAERLALALGAELEAGKERKAKEKRRLPRISPW